MKAKTALSPGEQAARKLERGRVRPVKIFPQDHDGPVRRRSCQKLRHGSREARVQKLSRNRVKSGRAFNIVIHGQYCSEMRSRLLSIALPMALDCLAKRGANRFGSRISLAAKQLQEQGADRAKP